MDIAVLIVDDFPLVRRGLESALAAEPAIRVVGEAGDPSEALEKARVLRPDVVLLDLRLGGENGLDLIEHLTNDSSGLKVLVVTAIEKLDTMWDAAEAGARGYLSKSVSGGELRGAIITVFGGGTVFGFSAGAHPALSSPRRSSVETADFKRLLTARERQVLTLVAHGKTDREVAEHLALSHRTVQNHLAAVRRKTGMRRRTEMASWAVLHISAEL